MPKLPPPLPSPDLFWISRLSAVFPVLRRDFKLSRARGAFECVVDLYSQISHRALAFAMAQEQLHRSEVLGSAVDQSGLGSSHGVGPHSRNYPSRSPRTSG